MSHIVEPIPLSEWVWGLRRSKKGESMKRNPLVNGELYHVCSKSIAGFKIFRNNVEYERMQWLFRYYRMAGIPMKFSKFITKEKYMKLYREYLAVKEGLVDVIAYVSCRRIFICC